MNVGGGGSIYLLKANFSLRLEKVLDPPFENSAQMQTFLEKHTPLELSQPNMTWLWPSNALEPTPPHHHPPHKLSTAKIAKLSPSPT